MTKPQLLVAKRCSACRVLTMRKTLSLLKPSCWLKDLLVPSPMNPMWRLPNRMVHWRSPVRHQRNLTIVISWRMRTMKNQSKIKPLIQTYLMQIMHPTVLQPPQTMSCLYRCKSILPQIRDLLILMASHEIEPLILSVSQHLVQE